MMDNKTKDALKQLQAEIRQLQTALSERAPSAPDDVPAEGEINGRHARGEAVVQFTVQAGGAKSEPLSFTEGQIARVPNEAAAAIGYALASAQKISLLRALLGKTSEGAAELGDLSGLSTGSLYHHLRELMRAGLVRQGGRNQYSLTARGQRALLLLLALAAE